MKRLAIILLLLLPASCSGKHFQPWSGQDVVLQTAVTVTSAVDWGQTRDAAEQPDVYYESNPVIGGHPSTEEVDIYSVSSIALKALVTWFLDPEYRPWWQSFCIGISASNIMINNGNGLRINF